MGNAKQTTRSQMERALHALDDMKRKLDRLEYARREPIAIVGMACRMPGEADTPEKLWENLVNGVDAVSEVPKDRFDIDTFYDAELGEPGKTTTRYGGFVDNVEEFEPSFFELPPRVAAAIDPQQRMFLMTCWEAFEHAGIAPDTLNGSATGIWVGIWGVDYWHRLASRPIGELDSAMILGNTHSALPGNVAYLLGLKGPAMAVDTACSSSLVTVDLACQSLRSGACDLAVTGGVNLILSPENFIALSQGQFLAPDGRCKTFDARADGFGRAEGCGVVLLKRLSDALSANDRILAVIRGTAVNQDGKTSGRAVPNGPSQQAVVRSALAQGGVDPLEVGFVEAHGTGTALGDPIEVAALNAVYGRNRPMERPLWIGSIKSNLGHLESAAGVAGLMKAALALANEEIPANLHFETPNPHIEWDRIPIRVVTERTPWPRGETKRFAAVSSFGASGTNAHVVLEEPPATVRERPKHRERSFHVLTLSAKTREALDESVARYRERLSANDLDIGDVCYTANTGRAHARERVSVVAATTAELSAKLEALAEAKAASGVFRGRVKRLDARPPIGFLYTGQGAQYAGMGGTLYETHEGFRDAIDRCDAVLRGSLPRPLLEALYPSEGQTSLVDDTTYTQPALFAVEYALTRLWQSFGIEPSWVSGHSIGEYVAACVAGVFPLEDALALVAARGRLMGALPREGAMVAVFASESVVEDAIAGREHEVSIAAVNAPANVVVSGRTGAVEAVARELEASGVEVKRLNVSHAFHSPLMEPMLEEFEKTAREIAYAPPRIALVSCLTGALASEELTVPEYWVSQVRRPVRFADAVRTMHGEGCELFLEAGPQPVLSGLGLATLGEASARFFPSLRRDRDDWERVCGSLAELYAQGIAVDWKGFDRDFARRKVTLPTYPFARKRFWIDAERPQQSSPGARETALADLLDAGKRGAILSKLEQSGKLEGGDVQSFSRVLEAYLEEQERASGAASALVSEYYDAVRSVLHPLEGPSAAPEEEFLTFGPFHDVVPGFSWVLTCAEPHAHPEFARLALKAQKEMRRTLFRHVDFDSCRSVLDFGCGYGSDLVSLARKHGHLRLTGYTLSAEQARVASEKARALGLEDRISIFRRDSAKDEFPGHYDLAFGFEVVHHVRNKQALFSNLDRHLNDKGMVVLADFISNAGFDIDHDETSSFFITKDEWVELLSDNHLLVLDAIDISREIANFLDDPNFDEHLEKVARFREDQNIRSGFRSYEQLGKLLGRGLTDYVLLSCRKESSLSAGELRKRNDESLSELTPYAELSLAGGSYSVSWEAQPLPPGDSGSPRSWIVFCDRTGTGDRLVKALGGRGDRVLRVYAGSEVRAAEEVLEIDPRRPEAFRHLMAHAQKVLGDEIAGAVHLFGLDAPASEELTEAALEDSQELVCGSVLRWVQAVTEAGAFCPAWLVTRGAQPVRPGDRPQVAQSPLVGLGKTVFLEHPELWGGMIDLDPDGGEDEIGALARELAHPAREYHVAHRGGERRVARLARTEAPEEATPPVEDNASYWITGGLGALGLEVSDWLARVGARHLVLTGRRPPSAQARERIAALARQGVTVRVMSADITKSEDVASVVSTVESSMPPLKGVIHAAGVLDDGVLVQQDWERFRRVLAPKVAGTFQVHRHTERLPLSFFVCFSSAASILGSAGQGNYAAANAFLDAFAHYRRARGLPGLSINWGAWGESGMAAELDAVQQRRLAARGVGFIDPIEGARALGHALGWDGAQLGIVPIAWSKFFDAGVEPPAYLSKLAVGRAERETTGGGEELLARVGEADGAERRRLVEEYLRDEIAEILGYEDPSQLDRDLPLLELGFDSLVAVQMRNRIKAGLEVDVAIGTLYESASIDTLAERVEEALALKRVVSTAAASEGPRGEPSAEVEVI